MVWLVQGCGQEVAGVIVEDGQRVDFLAADPEETLEVELPEFVGLVAFEALNVVRLGVRSADAVVATEDGRGGFHGRRGPVVVDEVGDDLARPPTELVADGEDSCFEFGRGACG